MSYIKLDNYIQHNHEELATTIKGAISELEACAWLLSQGYEVFRNVCPTGKADIVIWKKGEFPKLIDVKSNRAFSKVDGVLSLCKINDEFIFVEKTRKRKNKNE